MRSNFTEKSTYKKKDRKKHPILQISRAKAIQERTRFCEKHVCFEITALFTSPKWQGKKSGNFKISMHFTEMNPFLYCPSSSGKLNNPI